MSLGQGSKHFVMMRDAKGTCNKKMHSYHLFFEKEHERTMFLIDLDGNDAMVFSCADMSRFLQCSTICCFPSINSYKAMLEFMEVMLLAVLALGFIMGAISTMIALRCSRVKVQARHEHPRKEAPSPANTFVENRSHTLPEAVYISKTGHCYHLQGSCSHVSVQRFALCKHCLLQHVKKQHVE